MGNFSKNRSLAGAEASVESEKADNHFAVGKTFDPLAHSKFASKTLVFSSRTMRRMAAITWTLTAAPLTWLGAVVSTRYSTVNMVRTIGDVLGPEHLNLNTAYQRPMTDVFDITQSPAWTYSATASTVLKTTTLELTMATPDGPRPVRFAEGPDVVPLRDAASWEEQTRGFDFSSEDRRPADLFNRIVWQGVIGDRCYPEQRDDARSRLGEHSPAQVKNLAAPITVRGGPRR